MMPMLTPWLTRLAPAFAFFSAGAGFGYSYADNACQARQVEVQTQAIERHDQVADAGNKVERQTVRRTVKTETVFNGIQQGAITYAQAHPAAVVCRLDDDGLRLWNAANAGADTAPAGERDAALPGSDAAAEWLDDGSADQSHRSGEGLPPVQGSAPGPGGLAGGDAQPHRDSPRS